MRGAIIRDELCVEMRAVEGGRSGEHAVIFVGIALRLHQRLLAAGGTAREVIALCRVAVKRRDERLREGRHQVGGAPAEILPLLGMTDKRVGVDSGSPGRTHVRIRGGKAAVYAVGKLAVEDAAGISAIAGAEKRPL